jgi:eukaryotic-like serine/threonine-protein kinase
MAPEQALGQPVDRRADLFAVAAIIYEVAAGRPPFAGLTLHETLHRLTGPDPAPLEPLEAAGAAALVELLQRGLAKDPDERFQSAAAFIASLRAALAAMEQSQQRSVGGATQVLHAQPSSGMRPQSPAPFGPQLLGRLEEGLLPFLGPAAQTVVRRSAAKAATLDELYQLLDAALLRPEDRATFARHRGAAAGNTFAGEADASRSPLTAGGFPLGAATLAAAEETLTFFVGPIARVLVRKAAAQVTSVAELQDRLVGHIPHPADAAEFRRKFRARLRE